MPEGDKKTVGQEKIIRNWKDPKDYESMKDYSLEQWAWEFLRRNPQYVKKWEEILEYLRGEGDEEILDSWPCNEWGLEFYLDPGKEYSHIEFIPYGGYHKPNYLNSKSLSRLYVDVNRPNLETGEATLTFNVRLPLTPQIEAAKGRLEEFRQEVSDHMIATRESFKPRDRNEWIMHIRFLDAKAAGASDREIVDELYPNEAKSYGIEWQKKTDDKRNQAKRFVEIDYRLIPFHKEKKTKSS